MTYIPMTKRDAKESGLTPLEHAAEVCAAKTSNWLVDELEKHTDDDGESPYNTGGHMIFDPEHQGGGFSGEFTEDSWFVPLERDGKIGQPTVWTAVIKAFIAGAKWQKRKSK